MALPPDSNQPSNRFVVKVFPSSLQQKQIFVFQVGPGKVEIYPQSSKVSYEEITASALDLRRINEMVSPHLSIPRQIDLYLFDGDSRARHAGGLQMILAPVPMKKGQPDAALAHEAGHVIYQHNMGLRVLKDPRFTNNKRWAIRREMGNEELKPPHLLSFEELFSDLLAVLYARDGKAIADQLAAAYPDLKEHQIQSRDFTRTEPLPCLDSDVAPYGLQGTRFLIGQSYLQQTLQANNEGPLLKLMLDLFYEEFVDFYLGNHPAEPGFWRQADQRLSQAVSKTHFQNI